jgi:hypothetical protein
MTRGQLAALRIALRTARSRRRTLLLAARALVGAFGGIGRIPDGSGKVE